MLWSKWNIFAAMLVIISNTMATVWTYIWLLHLNLFEYLLFVISLLHIVVSCVACEQVLLKENKNCHSNWEVNHTERDAVVLSHFRSSAVHLLAASSGNLPRFAFPSHLEREILLTLYKMADSQLCTITNKRGKRIPLWKR